MRLPDKLNAPIMRPTVALIVLQELGYTWNTVNGWGYWKFDGETTGERFNRIVNEAEEND